MKTTFLFLCVVLVIRITTATVTGSVDIFTNPVTIGQPFPILVSLTNAENLECTFSVDKLDLTIVPNTFKYPSPQDRYLMQAVILGCPQVTATSVTLICNASEVPPSFKTDLGIYVEPATHIELKVHTHHPTATTFDLVMHLENTLSLMPANNLFCNITWNATDLALGPEETRLTTVFIHNDGSNQTTNSANICHAGASNNALDCNLGNMVGRTQIELKVQFQRNDQAELLNKINVSCSADFVRAPHSCPVANASTLPPAIPLTLDGPTIALAGAKFELKATQNAGKDQAICTVVLPMNVSLTPLSECKSDKGKRYNCKFEKGKTIVLPISVNASAQSGNLIFNVSCPTEDGKLYSSIHNVSISRSANASHTLDFFGFGKDKLNMSIIVSNPGPSDVQALECEIEYPKALPDTSDLKNCNSSSDRPAYTCRKEFGKQSDIKASYNISWTMPPDFLNTTHVFKVCCESSDGPMKPCQTASINSTNVNRPPVTPTDKKTKQPDSYFWTYTIVIVNLFLIALVVFVGMWWRNRAIARSMEGAGQNRFTEMELFSTPSSLESRPLSKAD